MRTGRLDRVNQQMQQEIATILQQELKDPRLGFVTITRVEVSKDLHDGKVFYSCLGGEAERARSQEVLDHSARFVHALIKQRFRLKIIPNFTFHYDPSISGAVDMGKVLDRLKERNAPPGPGADDQPPGPDVPA